MTHRHFVASLAAVLLIGAAVPSVAGAAWTSPVTVSDTLGPIPGSRHRRPGRRRLSLGIQLRHRYHIVVAHAISRRHLGEEKNLGAGTTPRLTPTPKATRSSRGGVQASPHPLIQARGLTAAGSLKRRQTISPPGQNASGPQVAVNATGKAALTWRRYDGHYWRIQGRTRSANGSLGPVKTLSPAGQNAYAPQVDINDQGRAVFVWQRFIPTSRGAAPGSRLAPSTQRHPQPGADPFA